MGTGLEELFIVITCVYIRTLTLGNGGGADAASQVNPKTPMYKYWYGIGGIGITFFYVRTLTLGNGGGADAASQVNPKTRCINMGKVLEVLV